MSSALSTMLATSHMWLSASNVASVNEELNYESCLILIILTSIGMYSWLVIVLESTALDSREGSVREFSQETERSRKGRQERGEKEGGGKERRRERWREREGEKWINEMPWLCNILRIEKSHSNHFLCSVVQMSNRGSRSQRKALAVGSEDRNLGTWAVVRLRKLFLASHFRFYPVSSRGSLRILRNDMIISGH